MPWPQASRRPTRVYVYDAQLGWDAAEALRPLGARAHCVNDLDALVETLAEAAREGDHVVIMSNGGFGGLHGRLLQRLGRERVSAMIIYLHGFNSSPASHKARAMASYMQARGLGDLFACPALPPAPLDAVRTIEAALARHAAKTDLRRQLTGRLLRDLFRRAAGCARGPDQSGNHALRRDWRPTSARRRISTPARHTS